MSHSLGSFSFEANSKVLGAGPPVPALSLQLAKTRHLHLLALGYFSLTYH